MIALDAANTTTDAAIGTATAVNIKFRCEEHVLKQLNLRNRCVRSDYNFTSSSSSSPSYFQNSTNLLRFFVPSPLDSSCSSSYIYFFVLKTVTLKYLQAGPIRIWCGKGRVRIYQIATALRMIYLSCHRDATDATCVIAK